MKIEGNGFLHLYSTKIKKEMLPSETKSEHLQTTDEMKSVKQEAKELNELLELLKKEEVFREDKVQILKEKIENGVYHVSGKDVLATLMGDKR